MKESVTGEFLESEVGRFTDICEPLCAAAEWLPGSREFVIACRNSGIPTYLLSGTPQAPREEMLASTSATDLFDVIIGSPPAKAESLGRILYEKFHIGATANYIVAMDEDDSFLGNSDIVTLH